MTASNKLSLAFSNDTPAASPRRTGHLSLVGGNPSAASVSLQRAPANSSFVGNKPVDTKRVDADFWADRHRP